MKCILQMVHDKIMGSVIDAIEYYLVARKESNDVFLMFYNHTKNSSLITSYKDKIIKLIENRYTNLDFEYKNNIQVVSNIELIKTHYERIIIIDWGTIPRVKNFLNCDEVIIISELSNKEFLLNSTHYKTIYYGEMPFVKKNYEYNMKMAFQFYPELHETNSGIYINSPNNLDIRKDNQISDIVKRIGKPIFYKSGTHLENLFEHFDTYLYYHCNMYFDTHPRLFQECYFYNKEILYYNSRFVKDGSYYRYYDLLNNGLKERYLTKEDEIIQLLIT